MISTILVATDGSEAAANVERYGAGLAGRLRARVRAVSVVEDRHARGPQADGLGVDPPSLDAFAAAESAQKPVLLLFQEIPG